MNLLDLPVEILDLILVQLDKYDLIKFGETCRYSNEIVKSVKSHYYNKYKPTIKEFWKFKRKIYYVRYNKLSCKKRQNLIHNYCNKLNVPWRKDSALFSAFVEGYLQKSPMECASIMKCVTYLHSRNTYCLFQEHIQPLLQRYYYDEIVNNRKKSWDAWNKAIELTIGHLNDQIIKIILNINILQTV